MTPFLRLNDRVVTFLPASPQPTARFVQVDIQLVHSIFFADAFLRRCAESGNTGTVMSDITNRRSMIARIKRG